MKTIWSDLDDNVGNGDLKEALGSSTAVPQTDLTTVALEWQDPTATADARGDLSAQPSNNEVHFGRGIPLSTGSGCKSSSMTGSSRCGALCDVNKMSFTSIIYYENTIYFFPKIKRIKEK